MRESELMVGRTYNVQSYGETFVAKLVDKRTHRYESTGKLIYVYELRRADDGRRIVIRHRKFLVSVVDAG